MIVGIGHGYLKMTQLKSVRFFPEWNEIYPYSVIGFLEFINYILSIQPTIDNWIEIGSHLGESSTLVLGFPQIKKLHCIEASQESCEILQQKFSKDIQKSRCSIIHEISDIAERHFINESVDVVYIDANHSFESVSKDIENYYHKVKSCGFFAGHDYSNAWPGVKEAVNNFIINYGYSPKDLIVFSDSSWLFRKK